MGKLICSAYIPDELEREKMMLWVKWLANGGYSEREGTVYMIYKYDESDLNEKAIYNSIIHIFESYPVHSIESIPNSKRR